MIDESNQIIFVHIPKTGGTSIESVMRAASLNGFILATNPSNTPILALSKHSRALQYRSYVTRNGGAFSDYRSFSIVRNPWERMASWWRFKTTHRSCHINFNAWIKGRKWIVKTPTCEKLFLMDKKGALLVDGIGRFENLEIDFNEFTAHIYKDLHFPHKFNLGKFDYKSLYNQESIDEVAKQHSWVIENFKYDINQL